MLLLLVKIIKTKEKKVMSKSNLPETLKCYITQTGEVFYTDKNEAPSKSTENEHELVPYLRKLEWHRYDSLLSEDTLVHKVSLHDNIYLSKQGRIWRKNFSKQELYCLLTDIPKEEVSSLYKELESLAMCEEEKDFIKVVKAGGKTQAQKDERNAELKVLFAATIGACWGWFMAAVILY